MRRPFPEKGRPPQEVLQELEELQRKDVRFESGRILGSMCTKPHPIALEAYRRFLETNLGDPVPFEGARTLERRAIESLLSLLSAPPEAEGVLVSGGSEANITALRVAREVLSGRREVVLPRSAHFSFQKGIELLGLLPRWVGLDDSYRTKTEEVGEAAGRSTAVIVAVAGSTEHGAVDDIQALGEIAQDCGAFLHVDAAYGGLLLPFLRRLGRRVPDFDFTVEGVSTLTVDPHKMGLSPIGAGFLACRKGEWLERISTPTPYVSIEKQATLQGTRSGGPAAGTYASFEVLGESGYVEIVRGVLRVASLFESLLQERGISYIRASDLPVFVLPTEDPMGVRGSLRDRGWYVSLAPLSRGIKVVVMPHVTEEAIRDFVSTLDDVLGGEI